MAQQSLSLVSREFSRYAERDYRGSSHLYELLASFISTDAELLTIASHGQSALPNLFFGAVHYLLMRCQNEPLAHYYPSLHKTKQIDDKLYPLFHSFCIRHEADLIQIISTRIVQTNEVSRCAYLYPAFMCVSQISENAPLAMIDIGAGAGLHLLWDLYGYDYGLNQIYGNPKSPVMINSELKGDRQPAFDQTAPRAGCRFGIDLKPISPGNKDDIAWLDALIWPEHHSRREMFYKAIDILDRERNAITLFEGDAADLLPHVLAKVSADEVPCVYQTHIWRQLSEATKSKVFATLKQFGENRKVFFVSALNQLKLELFAPSGYLRCTLANYEQHGSWVEWLFNGQADTALCPSSSAFMVKELS